MAPVDPGIPDRHSKPAKPSSTVAATSSSQGSPASTTMRSPSRATPRVCTWATTPGKPSSATTTLLPPASTSTGSPARSASRTTSISSSCVEHGTSRSAGPPSRRVVSWES